MTLPQFQALVATLPRRFRHRVAGAVLALDAATKSGEDPAVAVRRLSSTKHHRDALLDSGQLANFQSIAEPLPILQRLSPATFVIGSRNLAVHCFGQGFTEQSQINFAGNLERTDFWTPGDISTVIYSDVWLGPDQVDVFVSNPAGDSAPLKFRIAGPSPAALYSDS